MKKICQEGDEKMISISVEEASKHERVAATQAFGMPEDTPWKNLIDTARKIGVGPLGTPDEWVMCLTRKYGDDLLA